MKATPKSKAKEESTLAKKTMRVWLDADVLAWLKKDGAGYQTRVNRMLKGTDAEGFGGAVRLLSLCVAGVGFGLD